MNTLSISDINDSILKTQKNAKCKHKSAFTFSYFIKYFWYKIRKKNQIIYNEIDNALQHDQLFRKGEKMNNIDIHDHENLAPRIIEAVRISQGDDGASEDEQNSQSLLVFGVKLGALRRKKRFKLEEIANKTNIDANYLFAIELGIVKSKKVEEHLPSLEAALGDNNSELSQLFFELMQET
jgi:hypothetical protein